MSEHTLVGDLQVDALLARIGSSEIAPGAGVAGAVALALGAACASKAVSVTLRHSPDDAGLHSALAVLQGIAGVALRDADRDARAFEEFVHQRNPAAVERLVAASEDVGRLIAELERVIQQVRPAVRPNMAGDLVAATALAAAARRIQQRNEDEALQQR